MSENAAVNRPHQPPQRQEQMTTRQMLDMPLSEDAFDRLANVAAALADDSRSPRDALLCLSLLQSINEIQRLKKVVAAAHEEVAAANGRANEAESARNGDVARRLAEIQLLTELDTLTEGMAHYPKEERDRAERVFRDRMKLRMVETPQEAKQKRSGVIGKLAEAKAVSGLLAVDLAFLQVFLNSPEGIRWLYVYSVNSEWWQQPYWSSSVKGFIPHVLQVIQVWGEQSRLDFLAVFGKDIKMVDLFEDSVYAATITPEGVTNDPGSVEA